MATVKIPCPHCNRLCALDPSRLPNKPVAFNCPGCSGKVMVDPSRLDGAVPPTSPAAPAPLELAVAPAAAAPAPAGVAASSTAPFPVPDTPTSRPEAAESLELPPGATLPRGTICGDGGRVAGELRRALESHGCSLDALADPAALADRVAEQVPPLLIFVVRAAGRPPLELLKPLGGLIPAARRRTFVVLVADNLTTLDGSQAFFYNVDLILSSRDVSAAASVIYSALQHHRRLAGPFIEALDEIATG